MALVGVWRSIGIFAVFLMGPHLAPAQEQGAIQGPFDSTVDEQGSFAVNPKGALRFNYFRSSRLADGESDFYGATAQVTLTPVFSRGMDGKIDARFIDPDIAQSGRTPNSASLQEAYLSVHLSAMDLRVGKQNVAWGRADAANPTDNLTPRDYTLLLPFDEDLRFGTTAIKLDAYVTQEHTVVLFMTPFFEPSILQLPLPPGTVVRERKPEQEFANSEVGVKVDKAGGDVDWSVSYYHGYSLLPEIRFVELLPSGSLLEKRYPAMDVFGADMASNFGRTGFRAEAAYYLVKEYDNQEASYIQSYWSYVVGVDRTFLENLNINIQLLGNWIPDYVDPASYPDVTQRSMAEANAALFGQLHRANYGFTLRIGDRWCDDALEAEILLMAYFHPWNAYFRPLITYAFTDRVMGSVGAEVYSGQPHSYFGSIKSNRGGFAEIRYSF